MSMGLVSASFSCWGGGPEDWEKTCYTRAAKCYEGSPVSSFKASSTADGAGSATLEPGTIHSSAVPEHTADVGTVAAWLSPQRVIYSNDTSYATRHHSHTAINRSTAVTCAASQVLSMVNDIASFAVKSRSNMIR